MTAMVSRLRGALIFGGQALFAIVVVAVVLTTCAYRVGQPRSGALASPQTPLAGPTEEVIKEKTPEPDRGGKNERKLETLPRDGDEEGDPNDPKKIQAMLDVALSHVGTLRIRVSEAGAQVLVNGEIVGTSPLAEDVFVAPGPQVVKAKLEGHEDATASFTINMGRAQMSC